MLKIEHNIIITKVDISLPVGSPVILWEKAVDTVTSTYKLVAFKSVSIEEDNENLTNTALITIPYLSDKSGNIDKGKMTIRDGSLFYLMGEDKEVEFKKGDRVDIELYYNGKKNGKKQFIGYISAIKNIKNEYVEIYCEDFMWLFKNKLVNFSFSGEDANLYRLVQNLLYDVVKDFAIVNKIDYSFINNIVKLPDDINLGKFNTTGYRSISDVLKFIKDTYGFYFFTRNEYTPIVGITPPSYETKAVLYGGFRYPLEVLNEANVEYSKTILLAEYGYVKGSNITIDASFSDKSFNKNTDLVVLFGSKSADGSASKDKKALKGEFLQVATIDGINVVTDVLQIQDLLSKNRPYKVEINIDSLDIKTLEKLCLEKWNKFELNDNDSTIITLGLPIVRQGDIAQVGVNNYYINRVLTQCDESNGFIQTLTLGGKLN